MGTESKVIAAALALCAFAIAVIAGLLAGLSAADVLGRALLALIVCHILGMAIGAVLQRVLEQHEAEYRAAHPMPDMSGARVEGAPAGDRAEPATGVARA